MDDYERYLRRIKYGIENFEKQFRKVETKRVQQAQKMMNADFAKKQKRVYKEIFNDVITSFYNSYEPNGYVRVADESSQTGGLYNVFNGDAFSDEEPLIDVDIMTFIDPSEMTISKWHSIMATDGEDYMIGRSVEPAFKELFEITFLKGYHGGATKINSRKAKKWGKHPSPGTPYWRTSGLINIGGGGKRWHRWGRWYTSAFKSDAPYDLLNQKIEEADNGELEKYGRQIATAYYQDVERQMRDYADNLAKYYFK